MRRQAEPALGGKQNRRWRSLSVPAGTCAGCCRSQSRASPSTPTLRRDAQPSACRATFPFLARLARPPRTTGSAFTHRVLSGDHQARRCCNRTWLCCGRERRRRRHSCCLCWVSLPPQRAVCCSRNAALPMHQALPKPGRSFQPTVRTTTRSAATARERRRRLGRPCARHVLHCRPLRCAAAACGRRAWLLLPL